MRTLDVNPAADPQGPFGWNLTGLSGITINTSTYGSGNALSYAAVTGANGVVARQLILLSPGTYELSGSMFEGQSDGPAVSVRLTCALDGGSLASVPVASSVFRVRASIPTKCSAQWVEIVIDGGDSPTGASGALGNLHVRRLGDKDAGNSRAAPTGETSAVGRL